jgi:hypothetical protein
MSIATEVIPAEAYVGGDFFLLATSSPLSGAVRRSGLGLEVDCLDRVERLGAEDGVLLYTDGLVEARGGGSRYGTNRLSEVLRHGKRLTPPEIWNCSNATCRSSRASGSATMSARWLSAASSGTPRDHARSRASNADVVVCTIAPVSAIYWPKKALTPRDAIDEKVPDFLGFGRVARPRFELGTPRFSVVCSTN